jgi:hypothetical protein
MLLDTLLNCMVTFPLSCVSVLCVYAVLQLHYNSLAPKPSASDNSVEDSSSEGSSSSEDEGKRKVLGSARLGRLFG